MVNVISAPQRTKNFSEQFLEAFSPAMKSASENVQKLTAKKQENDYLLKQFYNQEKNPYKSMGQELTPDEEQISDNISDRLMGRSQGSEKKSIFSSSGRMWGSNKNPVQQEEEMGLQSFPEVKMEGEEKISKKSNNPIQRKSKIKLGGFDFSRDELPMPTKRIPPIGPLESMAKMQSEQLKENKKEIQDYAKPYENLKELKDNEHYAKQAKDLIYNGNITNSYMKKVALAVSEGKIGNYLGESIKKIAKTSDEQKLAALVMRFARPKDIGGSNPSTREVLLALERYPDILNSKEANKYLIDEMVRSAELDVKKSQLIGSLRRYDPHMDASTFKDIVNNKLEGYASKLPSLEAVNQKEVQRRKDIENSFFNKRGEQAFL